MEIREPNFVKEIVDWGLRKNQKIELLEKVQEELTELFEADILDEALYNKAYNNCYVWAKKLLK